MCATASGCALASAAMASEGLKEAINPDPSLDLGPCTTEGLGLREAQAKNVVADTARGLRGARGLEAGQLLRVRVRR